MLDRPDSLARPVPVARRARPLVLVTGLLCSAALAVAGCGPTISSDDASTGAGAPAEGVLQAPTGDAPSGEITIWDRSGDLYEVFDAAIEDFNEVYPDITVNHQAVDIDAKLQNTLITTTLGQAKKRRTTTNLPG